MKETKLEEIKQEELKYFGKILEEPKINPDLEDYSGMKVQMLFPLSDSHYDEWVYAATHACLATWEQFPYKDVNKMSQGEKEKQLNIILEDRPISVALEMPKFAFKIIGLTRAMTHQLVRHRQMAFGQQSIRVVDPTGAPVRLPEILKTDYRFLREKYENCVMDAKELYKEMVENDIPREQARNILPIGTTTSIVMTANLRVLIDYFRGRTSSITQGEHHYLVYLIALAFKKGQPQFFNFVCTKVNGLKELVESGDIE